MNTGTGEALPGPDVASSGAAPAYNQSNGKSHRAGWASDGVIVPLEGSGQHNLARGKDNHSTHKTPAIKKWLLAYSRFHVHFTLTSSSWLNLVERWFGEITEKWILRGTHRSVKELADSITVNPVDRDLERIPSSLRLAQDRRRDSRFPQGIS